ncbi:hypothetical protein MGG_16174 [Pyricularia oryzae 70-15]|uniref:Uncharacterized protein n=2 Tax=Pyricularia oryzae TaxID=318829 RepID=G4MM28_PYRO7|nr:uncharacterized protein MGG_16174 [Pyricularia oryzae 70-15]EHA56913.1 hypothetical protein MGG_16174 [Pyricularia oryzae 70-15]
MPAQLKRKACLGYIRSPAGYMIATLAILLAFLVTKFAFDVLFCFLLRYESDGEGLRSA